MKATLIECVKRAGELLLEYFGKTGEVRVKGSSSSIVTAADLAAEKLIFEIIGRRHPEHNLLGEESGLRTVRSDVTWVVDPLDGTSNFAAGLPWFGVMAAVLQKTRPVLAAMYLPVSHTLYFAERGRGLTRDGQPVRMTDATELRSILCAYGMDAGAGAVALEKQARLAGLLVSRTRNLRQTNCLLDFCYTLDGRLGACLNANCKVWDIAAACLMFPEAGGRFTDWQGRAIRLDLEPATYLRTYAVVGAAPALHRQVLMAARTAGF